MGPDVIVVIDELGLHKLLQRNASPARGRDPLDRLEAVPDDRLGYGTRWSGWNRRGGILIRPPNIVSWGPNRLDVFGIGVDAAL